jgi:frataxin-like iron-binding protein CyaY
MEIATLSNLIWLASEISGLSFSAEDAKLSEEAFINLVEDTFAKIDTLPRWSQDGMPIHLLHFQLKFNKFGRYRECS